MVLDRVIGHQLVIVQQGGIESKVQCSFTVIRSLVPSVRVSGQDLAVLTGLVHRFASRADITILFGAFDLGQMASITGRSQFR